MKEVRNLNHLFKFLTTLSIGGCGSLIRVFSVRSLQHLQVLHVSESEQMIAVFGSQRSTAISHAYPAMRQLILRYLPKLYQICRKELSFLAWKHCRCPVWRTEGAAMGSDPSKQSVSKRATQATKMVGWAKVGFQRGWKISPSILQTIVKNENEHRVCRIPCLLIVICVLRFELLRLLVSTNILLACFH